MKMLNDDTTQILLAIVLGIVICWFIFGRNCGNNGFSVGGQICVGQRSDMGSPCITLTQPVCQRVPGCRWNPAPPAPAPPAPAPPAPAPPAPAPPAPAPPASALPAPSLEIKEQNILDDMKVCLLNFIHYDIINEDTKRITYADDNRNDNTCNLNECTMDQLKEIAYNYGIEFTLINNDPSDTNNRLVDQINNTYIGGLTLGDMFRPFIALPSTTKDEIYCDANINTLSDNNNGRIDPLLKMRSSGDTVDPVPICTGSTATTVDDYMSDTSTWSVTSMTTHLGRAFTNGIGTVSGGETTRHSPVRRTEFLTNYIQNVFDSTVQNGLIGAATTRLRNYIIHTKRLSALTIDNDTNLRYIREISDIIDKFIVVDSPNYMGIHYQNMPIFIRTSQLNEGQLETCTAIDLENTEHTAECNSVDLSGGTRESQQACEAIVVPSPMWSGRGGALERICRYARGSRTRWRVISDYLGNTHQELGGNRGSANSILLSISGMGFISGEDIYFTKPEGEAVPSRMIASLSGNREALTTYNRTLHRIHYNFLRNNFNDINYFNPNPWIDIDPTNPSVPVNGRNYNNTDCEQSKRDYLLLCSIPFHSLLMFGNMKAGRLDYYLDLEQDEKDLITRQDWTDSSQSTPYKKVSNLGIIKDMNTRDYINIRKRNIEGYRSVQKCRLIHIDDQTVYNLIFNN